jgi:hypothetical protein
LGAQAGQFWSLRWRREEEEETEEEEEGEEEEEEKGRLASGSIEI